MQDSGHIDSLTLLDLDVEMLEERIEMSAFVNPNFYDSCNQHVVVNK